MTLAASCIEVARSGASSKNHLQHFRFSCIWPSVAMPDHLSPPEVLRIWTDRWRRMRVLLEFSQEINSQFKGLWCRVILLFCFTVLTSPSHSSTTNRYLSLITKSTSLTKSHLVALATGCTGNGTTANRRNKKCMMHWLHVLWKRMSFGKSGLHKCKSKRNH